MSDGLEKNHRPSIQLTSQYRRPLQPNEAENSFPFQNHRNKSGGLHFLLRKKLYSSHHSPGNICPWHRPRPISRGWITLSVNFASAFR